MYSEKSQKIPTMPLKFQERKNRELLVITKQAEHLQDCLQDFTRNQQRIFPLPAKIFKDHEICNLFRVKRRKQNNVIRFARQLITIKSKTFRPRLVARCLSHLRGSFFLLATPATKSKQTTRTRPCQINKAPHTQRETHEKFGERRSGTAASLYDVHGRALGDAFYC